MHRLAHACMNCMCFSIHFPFIRELVQVLLHSFIHSCLKSLIPWSARSSIGSCMHSFTNSSMQYASVRASVSHVRFWVMSYTLHLVHCLSPAKGLANTQEHQTPSNRDRCQILLRDHVRKQHNRSEDNGRSSPTKDLCTSCDKVAQRQCRQMDVCVCVVIFWCVCVCLVSVVSVVSVVCVFTCLCVCLCLSNTCKTTVVPCSDRWHRRSEHPCSCAVWRCPSWP